MIEYIALKETIIGENIISEGEGVFLLMMTSENVMVKLDDGTKVMMPTPLFTKDFKMYRL